MTQILDPQVALKVQKAISQAEDDLVIAIETALDNCEYIKTGDKKLEESQFNNLLRVADTTDSPEVIKNFICYQVGRDEKWGRGRNSLAAKIIQDIDISLKTRANQIVADNPSANLKYIWIQLIRRYIGYGSRYLKYRNEVNGKPNLSVVDPRNAEGNRDTTDASSKNGN
ncbi:hypothetical protein [Fischerella thermalis]|uniref:hypothetical protein n=1 Tax=Fischerella thermalis TaxID=372787 RepID=UPI000C808C40|nr:hypothetical protein [Fischerella thermalis]PLZ05070.1 hypothetical protein CBP18_21535 [Fischerella thermalis WC119]PLZ29479.1 hypothetical protein CBP28_10000 [Fischerella thermalis WC559]PLZ35805.1 hypothetical protein CBP10_02525 [Fischerella thermalis WC558]PLZ43354.1 hypothetical protein CBP27_03080 [Fischerella thermalis WC542]PLZ49506.1 hypothetical protein CBP15_17225 [Fischerella thermalis WC442]